MHRPYTWIIRFQASRPCRLVKTSTNLLDLLKLRNLNAILQDKVLEGQKFIVDTWCYVWADWRNVFIMNIFWQKIQRKNKGNVFWRKQSLTISWYLPLACKDQFLFLNFISWNKITWKGDTNTHTIMTGTETQKHTIQTQTQQTTQTKGLTEKRHKVLRWIRNG